MAHPLARLILVGVLGFGALTLGAHVVHADPPPPPVEPAPPNQDPPMPPAPFPVAAWWWPSIFPKCWPPWEPPGEPSPPPGDVRVGMFNVPFSPCPAPPPPPDGQDYPPLPPPPPPYPGCNWNDNFGLCVPGQELWGPLPPGYYGPQSWYPH